MPTARSGLAAATVGGRIYVAGGRDQMGRALDIFERYDPVARTWEELDPMPTPRYGAVAVSFGGRVVVIGGRGFEPDLPPGQAKKLIYSAVEAYDPQRGTWESLPSLSVAREGPAAFVLADTLFVAGGSDWRERILDHVEYLVDGTQRWRESDRWRLDVPRAAFGIAVAGGRPFAIGGFTPVPVSSVVDLSTGTSLPRPQRFRARGAHAVVSIGDSIFVMGGRGPVEAPPANPRGVLDDVDLLQASVSEWDQVEPLLVARESFAAVRVGRRVFVLGGRDEDGVVMKTVEMLDGGTPVAAEEPELPPDFFLSSAAPNPFSEQTTLRFGVTSTSSGAAEIAVFDLLGRRVRTLLEGTLGPGLHSVNWDGTTDDGTPLASGLYLCILTQGGLRTQGKVVLVR